MKRNLAIDVMRVVAILAVIAIHAHPFEVDAENFGEVLDAATVTNQLARFSVPFFFIVSGYFWAPNPADDRQGLRAAFASCRRIGAIFVFWSVVYLLPTDWGQAFQSGWLGPLKVFSWNARRAISDPVALLLNGTQYHLWFLSSLIQALLLAGLLLRLGLRRQLLAIGVVLYAIGLAGKAYADSPVGFASDFNFRDGPFVSELFLVAGIQLRARSPQAHWPLMGALLLVGGGALQLVEIRAVHDAWGTSMIQDAVVSSVPFGLGAALLGLSNPRLLQIESLARIGRFGLGIYVSHVLFIPHLDLLGRRIHAPLALGIVSVLWVFACGYALTRLMARSRWLRGFVS